jgi:hypothetical protein
MTSKISLKPGKKLPVLEQGKILGANQASKIYPIIGGKKTPCSSTGKKNRLNPSLGDPRKKTPKT